MRILTIVATSLILLTINVNNYAGHIDKTPFGLEFLYNYFYDMDYLDYVCDSLNRDEFDSAGNEVLVIYFPCSITDYDTSLLFIDGKPYVKACVFWHGDRDELCGSGVDCVSFRKEVYNVVLDLQRLPEIARDRNTDSIKYRGPAAKYDSYSLSNQTDIILGRVKWGSISVTIISPSKRYPAVVSLFPDNSSQDYKTNYRKCDIIEIKDSDTVNISFPNVPVGSYCVEFKPKAPGLNTVVITDVEVAADLSSAVFINNVVPRENVKRGVNIISWKSKD